MCWKTCLRGRVYHRKICQRFRFYFKPWLKRLPVANVLYAYDAMDGTVLRLESNNAIYMGDKMNDSLLNPIQAEEANVRIDIHPKRYYSDPHTQTISFSDGTTLPALIMVFFLIS